MMHLIRRLQLMDISLFYNFLLAATFIVSFHRADCYREAQDPEALCRSEMTSCGSCFKIYKDCGWCSDPSFTGEFRCDIVDNLRETCPKHLVRQAESRLEVMQDNPLRSASPYTSLPIQMQPQHLQLTMRPGAQLSFQLKYVHVGKRSDVYLLNSDAETQGLAISLTSDCPHMKRNIDDPRSCNNVEPTDILHFNISLTLMDCITAGDAVLSVGIAGLREVVAVYITPSCGCDCEKFKLHEQKSPICYERGTLICGKCMCDAERQGRFCEQDTQPMLTTPSRDDCRANNSYPDCSGRGSCVYGRCLCHNLAPTRYYGRYCECDDDSCPKNIEGLLCNGNGHCRCGTCSCDPEWFDVDCGCSTSEDNCRASNGEVCNGAGTCSCNRCSCNQNLDYPLNERCEPSTPEPQEPYQTDHVTFPEPGSEQSQIPDVEEESTSEVPTTTATTTTAEMMTTVMTTTEITTTEMEKEDDQDGMRTITGAHSEMTSETTSTITKMDTTSEVSTMETTGLSDTMSRKTEMTSSMANDIESPLGLDTGRRLSDETPDKSTITEKKSEQVAMVTKKPDNGAKHQTVLNYYLTVFVVFYSTYYYFVMMKH